MRLRRYPGIIAIGYLIAMMSLSACDPDPNETRILTRIPSPDGQRDAVYAEDMGGGATAGASEDVYLVPRGAFPRLDDRVFSADRVCRLQIRWLNNELIEVGYSAKAAKPADLGIPSPNIVHERWLGSDTAEGC